MIDILWVLTCAALVFMMQAGFCCLEAGYVRSKNSVNVAAKNLADFCLSTMLFWMVGYAFMFGATQSGWLGASKFYFSSTDASDISFFIYQMMFCGAATTIVSGAVSERTKFVAYLIITTLIAILIYPVFGHWAWANGPGGGGWLLEMGFIDFAGSTVVHSVAGWISLAAVLIVGPRLGRYSRGRNPFRSHSLPMSLLGVFIIWVGWIGFNGGSTLAINQTVPVIVLNTFLAGAFGGAAVLVLYLVSSDKTDIVHIMNGSLAGLVSVTAGANSVTPLDAVVIGAAGGILSVIATRILDKYHIDDVISAFPVHGVCGVWGTLSVALFSDLETLGTGLNRVQQFGVQAVGVATAAAWSFGIAFAILYILNKFYPLRVSRDAERVGLNISEHQQSTEQLDLLQAMEAQRRSGDFSRPVDVDASSETGHIAAQYNRVLKDLYEAKIESEQANNAKSDFLASMSHELRTPLNAIMGFSEIMTQQMFGPLGSEKYHEYADDITRSSRHLLSLVDDILDLSKIEAGRTTLVKGPVAVRSMFDDCLKVATGAIDASQIYFDIRMSTNIPPLYVDERACRQIILNILFNAIKFTPGGGRIVLRALVQDGMHVLEISDSGAGIPPEDLEKITEPFAQLATKPHIAKMGTGLGLSIAKALTEAHDGSLRIESELGVGTTVRVCIPLPNEE